MKNIKKFILYGCLVFGLYSVPARAQGPVYKPGDTFRLSVKFSGPDANKISAASMGLKREPVANTAPFIDTFDARDSKKIGQDTFEISFVIPKTQASGEYKITYIQATIDLGNGKTGFSYMPGEFTAKAFKVENSTTVEKPIIKDVTELPKQ